jgi:FkbM family methyltransferase
VTNTLPLLNKLLAATRIVGIDIGARGGFTTDLAPIAAAMEAIGFEPEQEECERLNAQAKVDTGAFRSLRYVPTAVGRAAEQRTLNIYRARGCTSLLTGNSDFAKLFAREDYFILDGQVDVKVERLDDAAQRFGFTDCDYMKIDIQGAELEAMQSAPNLVSNALLAIRSEVEFAPLYVDQPVFADVDAELRGRGFMLARFVQMHSWRRGTRVRNDRRAPGAAPLSEGQLIHGDALYFRRPETMPCATDADQDRLIRLGLLAFAYGHLDITATLFATEPVAQRISALASISAPSLAAELGAWHARRRRQQMRSEAASLLRDVLA